MLFGVALVGVTPFQVTRDGHAALELVLKQPFTQPQLTDQNILDFGFARILLPDQVKVNIERLPGGAAIGFAHVDLGEIGIVVVTQQEGGLAVNAGLAKGTNVQDTDRRRAIFEPIARSINEAIETALREKRSRGS